LSRPDEIQGVTHKIKTACGNAYVTVNKLEGKIHEIFAILGKSGGCGKGTMEGSGRLASLAIRSGASPEKIVKSLKGINCTNSTPEIHSCHNALAIIIEKSVTE